MPKCPICGREEISQEKHDEFREKYPLIIDVLNRAGVDSIVELAEKKENEKQDDSKD